ncbi:uncharacterized protein LOC127803391 [Diospyros lotus]|uniref:uncharacterized protein LOC127803391 n=1 Tax=Diospyros lotus TaxID=55363 RepID=UPI00224D8902|nr:uncharacterized protein LOC127803391 [Diospyros lotus]
MKRNGADSAEKDATANPCLQDEGASELEVSNLDLTVQKNTQNRVPEKESKRLQEASTVKPQEYIREIYADPPREHEAPRKCEKAPIECSSQDAKDQGVMDPENSHKGLVKLPPYPTVKQLLPGEVGEKFLEASNLEFDKIRMVFQSASKFSSPELTYISQGIEIKKKHLKGTITEQRDGENHSKETTEADDAIKKDTSNEKAMSSDVILAKQEEDRPCDDNEETIKIGQLQITGLTVPQVTDATAGEATDEKVNENFNEVPIHAANSPTHESIGTCNGKKDITSSDTNYSPKAMDNEKLEHASLEPACKGLILKNQEVLPAFSQEKVAEKGNKDTVDDKHYDFISDKQTMETVRVVEEVKCSHCEEEHKKNEEPAELQKVENEIDQANNHRAITEKGHKEGKHQKEKPYVLFHVEDPEVSNEKDIMDLAEAKGTSKDTQEQEKNSLPLSHEHIAIKADPSESTKNTSSTASEDVTLTQGSSTANTLQKAMVKDLKAGHVSGSGQKGIEYCEKKTMGEECQEAIENSILMDSTENSLSDMMQKSKTATLQMPDHGTGKRELTGDKEETQTQMAETAQAGEAKADEENDEQEEIYEPKTEESGTYAPVIVETSRDSDVKTPHKKSHKILSGVGSRVKHSIAKVKKAIIGKSSHPKIQSSK